MRGSRHPSGTGYAPQSAPVPVGSRTAVSDGRPGHPVGARPAATGAAPAAVGARTAISQQRGGSSNGGASNGGASNEGARTGTRVVPAATYWRRRFTVLAAFLLVLVTAVWSVSDELKVHRGATGGAAPASGHPRASKRGRTGSQSPQTGAVSRPNSSATPSLSAGRSAAVSPAPCPSQSIVLSLSTGQNNSGQNNSGQTNSGQANSGQSDSGQTISGQSSYGPAQLPVFRVSVVSTQPSDCSFNLGAGHLAVLIKKGAARIWSSADCVRGSGGLMTVLKRGVPAGRSIGWGRNTSAPGCSGRMRLVPAGIYTAYAVDGSLVSAPETLRLR